MNEVFERLSDVFEELRSDAGEREYSIQTEEAKKADKELKKENQKYEKFLSDLPIMSSPKSLIFQAFL